MAAQSGQKRDWAYWVERWGMPTVALIVIASWFKPHADRFIEKHFAFMDATSKGLVINAETQVKQTEILSRQGVELDRLDQKSDRSLDLLRDLHGTLVKRGSGRASGTEAASVGPVPTEGSP